MQEKDHIVTSSKFMDLWLIKFPIFFPIIYGIILFSFPNLENYLIFVILLFLAEPHFGATLPFFINKTNYKWITDNKIFLIYLPIIILTFSVFGYFKFNEIFLFIFFICNVYHVTRQSYGICKLYNKASEELKYQESIIYLVNSLFFIFAILRFYTTALSGINLFFINLLIILSLIILSIFYIRKFNFSENFLTFLTGLLIFYPLCFVSKPIHGILMGVTMHYTQYLALTYKISFSRNIESNINNFKIKKFLGFKNSNFILVILFYGLVMSILSISTKINNDLIKNLAVIPIAFQMLHFYIDSQLWKFSTKHNREVTLKHLT